MTKSNAVKQAKNNNLPNECVASLYIYIYNTIPGTYKVFAIVVPLTNSTLLFPVCNHLKNEHIQVQEKGLHGESRRSPQLSNKQKKSGCLIEECQRLFWNFQLKQDKSGSIQQSP